MIEWVDVRQFQTACQRKASFFHFLIQYLISGSSFPPWSDNYEILNKVSSFLQQINEQKAPIRCFLKLLLIISWILSHKPHSKFFENKEASPPQTQLLFVCMCVRVHLISDMQLITTSYQKKNHLLLPISDWSLALSKHCGTNMRKKNSSSLYICS